MEGEKRDGNCGLLQFERERERDTHRLLRSEEVST